MKALKISLAVIVLAAIGTGIFFWTQSIKEPEKVKAPVNKFIIKIEQEINQLHAKPNNKFCKEFYNKITLDINSFHNQSRFSSNQLENDQLKDVLDKNLYSVYVDKFIRQAFYILNSSEWRYSDRRFIKVEKDNLKNSKYLAAGSPVDKRLDEIQKALGKYWEINKFINSCNNFSYTTNSLSDSFPISEVRSKIQRAAKYRSNHLENRYVNNSVRLHNDLNKITQLLFEKHVLYLDTKIDYWSNMWCNYISHRDYSQNLHTTLSNEIDELGNSTLYYGVDVDEEYDRLYTKWNNDNIKAYQATYPCK